MLIQHFTTREVTTPYANKGVPPTFPPNGNPAFSVGTQHTTCNLGTLVLHAIASKETDSMA